MFVTAWCGWKENNTAKSLWPVSNAIPRTWGEFGSEMAIHYPGLKGLDKPIVTVFRGLLVCLDCGFTEFTVPRKRVATP
jgi:hypothetical protein